MVVQTVVDEGAEVNTQRQAPVRGSSAHRSTPETPVAGMCTIARLALVTGTRYVNYEFCASTLTLMLPSCSGGPTVVVNMDA